jgi:hypothetical protein
MYAVYQYAAGGTRANVLSDVTAIFAGETNKANLSATCVQAQTTITSTTASGWSVHDSAPATDAKVLKAAHSDEGSVYKYAYLTITDSSLRVDLATSWNEVAHTGTKSNMTGFYQQISVTTGGRIYLYSSARFMAFYGEYYSSGVFYAGTASYGGISGIFEITRIAPWLTTGSGFSKCIAIASSGYQIYDKSGAVLGTVKLPNGITDSTLITGSMYIPGFAPNVLNSNWASGPSGKIRNASNNLVIPSFPIFAGSSTFSYLNCIVGDLSSSCDVWLAPGLIVPDHTEYTISTKKYRYVPAYNSGSNVASFLLPAE